MSPTDTLDDMGMTPAERQRAYRRRLGVKPRGELKPCGTPAAARRHRRNNEPVCDLCKEAQRLESEKYNERRRQKKAA